LSIQELDSALEKLNENSAGGLDGIPTKFLKTFCGFLRIPLHKYTLHAFETGNLSQSFNSAGIKLIPKKGDITSLKNWRPISLLNSVFKLISKALDSRLQKLNEIILSRAQKGFTRNRHLHECIINIVESIAYSQQEQIPAFVLALDMAKAFDTVRHDFMNHVYRFFGIGDNLIKMLNTVSTGRTACIIKDDGSVTDHFPLGSGFPQGNPPSPDQFNMGIQIFIYKLDLDPAISPLIRQHLQLPVRHLNPDPVPFHNQNQIIDPITNLPVRKYGLKESGRETQKVEAFADDNDVIGRLNENSITCIKDTLHNFAVLSGLRCNVDKSKILLLGCDQIPEYVVQSVAICVRCTRPSVVVRMTNVAICVRCTRPSVVVRMTNDCLLNGYSLYFLYFLKRHLYTLGPCTSALHSCICATTTSNFILKNRILLHIKKY
jgi:hypothetical protein